MITQEEQMDLLKLISDNLTKEIECYAFGGNAMMFYGYKGETKDIDLLFEKEADRKEFINTLTILGFDETSPMKVYIPEKLRDPHRPLMFKREDFRFDLFVKQIFKTKISPKMQEDFYGLHEFNKLKVKIFRKEHLVILKAVTDRKNDFDDVKTILEKEKNFDWQYLIDEVKWQHKHGDSWIVLDVEKAMQELKKYIFIPEKYFRQIHALLKG